MRRQPQFESPEESRRHVRTAVIDAALHIAIIILSCFAMAAMYWLTVNGEKVDNHINHWIQP